jgi:hypothetical protein
VIQTHHLVHLWKIILWNFQDKTSINGLKFQETKIAKYEKWKHKSTIAFVCLVVMGESVTDSKPQT